MVVTAQNAVALCIDDYDLKEFTYLASQFGVGAFEYVVTPNVDHLVRYYDEPSFRDLYAQAGYILLDSRVLAHILRVSKGVRVRVCPGSDLTAALIAAAGPDDRIVLIGASAAQAERLRTTYGLHAVMHYEPPHGLIRMPDAIEACLRFVEAHSPFRYCFLAVGSPQQEVLAKELKRRGLAQGLALCVGGSINFLTGAERRAPVWMQRIGFEWLFRMLQNPRRLFARYLLRGPRIFALLPKMRIEFRRSTGPVGPRHS